MTKKLRKILKILLMSSIIIHSGILNTQDKSENKYLGKVTTLKSSLLEEDIKLIIYLPENYHSSKKEYPVFYLLDGEFFINQATAAVQFLSNCPYIRQNLIPELIVIGIVSNDRNRDFTPTHMPVYEAFRFPTSGGANKFFNFLKKELMPFIEKEYRTKPHKVLAGWSLGGLFTIHTYLNHPDDFSAYLAISPSLWWDNQIAVKQTESLIASNKLPDKKLTVTLGSLERGDMENSVKYSFLPLMMNAFSKNKQFRYLEVRNEGHNTAPFLGLYEGLKSLYYNWSFTPDILSDNSDNVDTYSLKLAKENGYEGNDAAESYEFLMNLAVLQGKYDESLKIAEYLAKKNPKSSYALFNLGIMYYRIEDLESAISCFKKAIQTEEVNSNPKQNRIEMYKKVLHDVEEEAKKRGNK
ncbi:MAG: tetratricopeptide repeat protein [Candidatus Aminicenantes bacterium]|nr:tetratricopeptide repeat protein [Candidatus Aminicenantes bacterium]